MALDCVLKKTFNAKRSDFFSVEKKKNSYCSSLNVLKRTETNRRNYDKIV